MCSAASTTTCLTTATWWVAVVPKAAPDRAYYSKKTCAFRVPVRPGNLSQVNLACKHSLAFVQLRCMHCCFYICGCTLTAHSSTRCALTALKWLPSDEQTTAAAGGTCGKVTLCCLCRSPLLTHLALWRGPLWRSGTQRLCLSCYWHSQRLYGGWVPVPNCIPKCCQRRNSLVFHSLDKITSLFLHLFPAGVVWTERWHPDVVRLGHGPHASILSVPLCSYSAVASCEPKPVCLCTADEVPGSVGGKLLHLFRGRSTSGRPTGSRLRRCGSGTQPA